MAAQCIMQSVPEGTGERISHARLMPFHHRALAECAKPVRSAGNTCSVRDHGKPCRIVGTKLIQCAEGSQTWMELAGAASMVDGMETTKCAGVN